MTAQQGSPVTAFMVRLRQHLLRRSENSPFPVSPIDDPSPIPADIDAAQGRVLAQESSAFCQHGSKVVVWRGKAGDSAASSYLCGPCEEGWEDGG